jgi:hypothetical protein
VKVEIEINVYRSMKGYIEWLVKDEVILSLSLITLLLHYIISVGTILMGE